MTHHLTIRVSGDVQGVFYRQTAVMVADQFGINGFIRNEPDGTVYIEAEGDPLKLSGFAAWCKVGPPGANVNLIDTTEGKVKNHVGFVIK